MTTVILDLPDSLAEPAGQAARAMHRPLEEVITAVLDVALPALEDVPPATRADLVATTRRCCRSPTRPCPMRTSGAWSI